jgi:hypothetical protein
MSITIFLLINGLGVAFLIYVLANFWKEGHRPKDDARKYATEFGRGDWDEQIVLTHPVSHSAQGGISVIPFQSRRQEFRVGSSTARRDTASMAVRRIFTR